MDDLPTTPVAQDTDSTVGFLNNISDPNLSESERSLIIDQYFNDYLMNTPEDIDIDELRPFLNSELAPYLDRDEIENRLEAVENKRYIGGTTESSKQMIEHQADPVMLFTGQYTHTVEDIRIKGGGIDFVFERIYKNQTYYDGPLGYSWDYNYNMWLREESPTLLVRSSGHLREDRYILHPIYEYFQPPDGCHDIIEIKGSSFCLTTLEGDSFQFERIQTTPLHRLVRVTDRYKNFLNLTYNTDGMLFRVLINSPQRYVSFEYDTLMRIIRISDHAGRDWLYEYDDFGDLIKVYLPCETSLSHRKYTKYNYSSAQQSGLLRHNLLTALVSDIGVVVENEYGRVSGSLAFNRVIRQIQVEGETLFEYEDIIQDKDWSLNNRQCPSYLTRVYNPNGHPIEHVFNKFGNLIARREQSIGSEGPRDLTSRYQYNADGALVASISPEGAITQYWYQRDDFDYQNNLEGTDPQGHPTLSAHTRLQFGLLLALIKRGKRYNIESLIGNQFAYNDFFPFALNSDPITDDIIIRYTYEPNFGRTYTISDPRVTTNADPRHPEIWDVSHPNYSRYQAHLTRYVYGLPFLANLERIDYPDCTNPDGSIRSGASHKYHRYDKQGRLQFEENAEGEKTEYEYYGNVFGPLEGFLSREIRDPSGLPLITKFDYTTIGAINSKTDPLNNQTTFQINGLGRISLETNPSGYQKKFFYDSEGRIVRKEIDATDRFGQPICEGPEVRLFNFDTAGNLLSESVGGRDLSKHLVTRHRYDGAGNCIETTLPNSNRVKYTYDSRNLLIKATRAPCTLLRSTSRTYYDGEQRKIFQADARGFKSFFTYDAFGQLIREIDALGNIRIHTYDKLGNELTDRFFEKRKDGSFYLLSRRSYSYDERGRRIIQNINIFDTPLIALQPEVEFLSDPGPGKLVITEYYLDNLGRIIKQLNSLGHQTIYEYNSVGKLKRRTDAMGNYIDYTYYMDGNVKTEEEHSLDIDHRTGTIKSERVYKTVHEYNVIGQRTATIDPIGNRTEWNYDSRGNLILKLDPLGNKTWYVYDIYGRRVETLQELTVSGKGGIIESTASIKQNYDNNGNRTSLIDPNGNITRYTYDCLDRQIQIDYPDGTWQASAYDSVNNLIEYSDSRGVVVLKKFDALNHCLRNKVCISNILSGSDVSGTSDERFSFDGLGHMLSAKSDFCTITSTFDSRGCNLSDTFEFSDKVGASLGPFQIKRTYDLVGNRVELLYPNGRIIEYLYDNLERLIRISSKARGISYTGSAQSDAYPILTHKFEGILLVATKYGNNTTTKISWDGARRSTEFLHKDARKSELLRLQFISDGLGNIRLRTEKMNSKLSTTLQYYDSLSRLLHIESIQPSLVDPNLLDCASGLGSPPTQLIYDTMIGSLDLPTGKRSLLLDLSGNRKEMRGKDASGPLQAYSIISGNRYSHINGSRYLYDGLGSIYMRGNQEYAYDHLGRLVRVTEDGNEVAKYGYDAKGRRVITLRNGHIEHTIFDGSNPLAILIDGVLHTMFVNENAPDSHRHLAQAGIEYWIHKDQIGTTRCLTDASGALTTSYSFDPFGFPEIQISAKPSHVPLFMGRPCDQDTGLYDFRSRFYDAVIGRFLQRDIKGSADGCNLYSAFANNPLSFVDPLGTESVRQWVLSDVEQKVKNGDSWTAGAEYVGYFMWNSLSFGFVDKNSDSYESFNGSDYVLMTIADTGRSTAIMGTTAVAGGALGAGGIGGSVVTTVAQTGASPAVSYAIGGAINGALSSAAALGTEDVIDVLGTGYRAKSHSVEEYAAAMGTGLATGALAGGLQGESLAQNAVDPNIDMGALGEDQASRITGQPRNVGSGNERLPVPGGRTPTGRQQYYIPDQPVNPTDAAEGTLSTRGTVVEVKNYVLSDLSTSTQNMPKAIAVANELGVPLEVYTSQNTKVCASFHSAVSNGEIIWQPSLNPITPVPTGAVAVGRKKPFR